MGYTLVTSTSYEIRRNGAVSQKGFDKKRMIELCRELRQCYPTNTYTLHKVVKTMTEIKVV